MKKPAVFATLLIVAAPQAQASTFTKVQTLECVNSSEKISLKLGYDSSYSLYGFKTVTFNGDTAKINEARWDVGDEQKSTYSGEVVGGETKFEISFTAAQTRSKKFENTLKIRTAGAEQTATVSCTLKSENMFMRAMKGMMDMMSEDFNKGDLDGLDELTPAELAALGIDPGADAPSEPLRRATTKKELEDHASRRVQIVVHKSLADRGYQYLTLTVDGERILEAPVSTAWERMAKAKTRTYKASTPVGQFFPDAFEARRFSNTWQVWLNNVIRFSGGVWIHATTPDHFMELGAPASGGCVRMYPSDAKIVYETAARFGTNNVAITVLPAPKEPQIRWNDLKKQHPPVLTPPFILDWRKANGIK